MKWVRDRTGRFEQRPYYHEQEIDVHCEDVVSGFLSRIGAQSYPISTDHLTVMIEQEVSQLDLYANLSGEGREVEGVTEFHRKDKPSVRVARYLSKRPERETRLRSTLAHEYGHVIFHNFLWTLDPATSTPQSFRRRRPPKCRRARIIVAPQSDWMEWQVGYAGAALLMPITPVKDLVSESLLEWGVEEPIGPDSDHHGDLIASLAESFAVSKDAAKTRLSKLGYLA